MPVLGYCKGKQTKKKKKKKKKGKIQYNDCEEMMDVPKDVVNAVECDLDHLCIGVLEEIAQRLDAALVDKVHDLLGGATRSSIGDGPGGFLLGLEIVQLEEVDQRLDQIGVNDGLK